MARERTWSNPDGLVVGFGTHSIDNNVPVVEGGRNSVKVAKAFITLSALEATASLTAASLIPQGIVLKRGSIVQRSTLEVVEAAVSGGGGTLNIGFFKIGDITTADDADGIDATVAVAAIDAIGEIVVCDGALTGATSGVSSVGATSNSDVVIVASTATAVFTAGKLLLTVHYVEPSYAAVPN